VSVYRSGKLIYALIWATHSRNDVLLKSIYAGRAMRISIPNEDKMIHLYTGFDHLLIVLNHVVTASSRGSSCSSKKWSAV